MKRPFDYAQGDNMGVRSFDKFKMTAGEHLQAVFGVTL